MTEFKTELELTGLERFSHLEDKIFRVVEAMKALRKENEGLRSENQKLRSEVERFRRDYEVHETSMVHLQKEREQLRERVERALNLLSTLDMRSSS